MASDGVSKDGGAAALDGLQEAIQKRKAPQQERRMVFATLENSRHLRHEQVLERWPLLSEDWAARTEETRLGSVDRTPGAASFGR
jgi:threonine dehydratase